MTGALIGYVSQNLDVPHNSLASLCPNHYLLKNLFFSDNEFNISNQFLFWYKVESLCRNILGAYLVDTPQSMKHQHNKQSEPTKSISSK